MGGLRVIGIIRAERNRLSGYSHHQCGCTGKEQIIGKIDAVKFVVDSALNQLIYRRTLTEDRTTHQSIRMYTSKNINKSFHVYCKCNGLRIHI